MSGTAQTKIQLKVTMENSCYTAQVRNVINAVNILLLFTQAPCLQTRVLTCQHKSPVGIFSIYLAVWFVKFPPRFGQSLGTANCSSPLPPLLLCHVVLSIARDHLYSSLTMCTPFFHVLSFPSFLTNNKDTASQTSRG